MPRIIFTSRYLKSGAQSHKNRLINYIARRGNAMRVKESNSHLPVTTRQKHLIQEILSLLPNSKESLEYEDYLKTPNRENASEFLSQSMEQHLDIIEKRKDFTYYLGSRPGAKPVADHALFRHDDTPINLSQVAKEISQHQGNLWTNVLSLRREDADRLDYTDPQRWKSLLKKHHNTIAKAFKIDGKNLRWYAAFHDESHHPHIHLMVYSTNPKEGFLTDKGIESLRSVFARDIFSEDLKNIYTDQTKARDQLLEKSEEYLLNLITEITKQSFQNDSLENSLYDLKERLHRLTGKKVYGYLPREVKEMVDTIVNQIPEISPEINECYETWCNLRNQVLYTYQNAEETPVPLSANKTFHSLKNIVIRQALSIPNYRTKKLSDDIYGGNATDVGDLDKSPTKDTVIPIVENDHLLFPTHTTDDYSNQSTHTNNESPAPFSESIQQLSQNDLIFSTTRLVHSFCNIIQEDVTPSRTQTLVDQKIKQKQRQKRITLGRAIDDKDEPKIY